MTDIYHNVQLMELPTLNLTIRKDHDGPPACRVRPTMRAQDRGGDLVRLYILHHPSLGTILGNIIKGLA